MIKKDAFLTVVYPQVLPYFGDICDSVRNQANKNFDFLVINDSCDEDALNSFLLGIESVIIKAVGSPSSNRQQGINFALNKGYRYILFCDADDTSVYSRYQKTIMAFENSNADIIASNLNIVDYSLKSIIDNYFTLELPHDRWLDENFISDKNVFGMSNTALRLSSLRSEINIPETTITDWYLFTILLHSGLSARYISEALVNYRQHDNNLIGINCFDVPTFKRLALLKYKHYTVLVENGYSRYQIALLESERLLQLSDNEIKLTLQKQLSIHKQPLWWQIVSKAI